jgi:hypothetical protein
MSPYTVRRTAEGLDPSDRQFLDKFESCAVSPAEFRHRDHVRLAYIYLTLNAPEIALQKTRAGLQRFLVHLGAPPERYHETITRAWLLAIEHFMREAGETKSFEQFAALSPRLLVEGAMETHYTRELLQSEAARQRFLQPDLQPIPPSA